MKCNLPILPEHEFRERWRSAYRAIEASFLTEIGNLAIDRQEGLISQEAYWKRAGLSASVLETLMAGARASRKGLALLLLEHLASICKATHTDCSLYDSAVHGTGGILRSLNGKYMPEHWLSEFLLEHCGLFHSGNDIELCQLPAGSFYIYGDHPAMAGKQSMVHLGICQVFENPEDLTKALSVITPEDLNNLTIERLLLLYPKGLMSLNTFLSTGDKTVNLVFSRKGDNTYIMDQETDAEYITEERLDDPERYIAITQLYAQGVPPSNARRLRK